MQLNQWLINVLSRSIVLKRYCILFFFTELLLLKIVSLTMLLLLLSASECCCFLVFISCSYHYYYYHCLYVLCLNGRRLQGQRRILDCCYYLSSAICSCLDEIGQEFHFPDIRHFPTFLCGVQTPCLLGVSSSHGRTTMYSNRSKINECKCSIENCNSHCRK